MIDQLINLCENNQDYFKNDKSALGVKLHDNFNKIYDYVNKSSSVIKEIKNFAGDYDFDDKTHANGYRSFIHIFNSAVVYTATICRNIIDSRGNFFFRKSFYVK